MLKVSETLLLSVDITGDEDLESALDIIRVKSNGTYELLKGYKGEKAEKMYKKLMGVK